MGGKTFFTKRRLPVAVDLKKKDLRAAHTRSVRRALSPLCGHKQFGAAGHNGAAAGAPRRNIVAGVEQVVSHLPGKWNNIQSLQLRTTNSVALPFYNALPKA